MKNIGFYIGIVLLGISILNGVGHLVSYIYNNYNISQAVSFPNVIIYVTIPIFSFTLIILIFSLFSSVKLKIMSVFNYFFIANIILNVSLYFYFQKESEKLVIEVRNFSNYVVQDVKINTRNGQQFRSAELRSGDNIIVDCECRSITHVDSIGINLGFEFPGSLPKYLKIIGVNEPVYCDSLKILIINDTLTLINYGVNMQWKELERYSQIYSMEEVNKLIPND